MSKKVEATIACPNCQNKFNVTLYRTIWGEYPENRNLVMNDEINVVACNNCWQKTKIPLPFMYTNSPKNFAVWWEPQYDPQIDEDKAVYQKATSANSYFSTAPRIEDWEDFKATIIKFEQGILNGEKGQRPDMKSMLEELLKNKR